MINELRVFKFSSLEEFISYTDTCPKEIGLRSWSGASSYEEAIKIAREGVDLKRAETAMKQFEHSRKEMVQVMDVTGSVVNMDAYLQGLPENMMEFPIVEEPTKFLNLFVDVLEHADISQEQMVNKAIAIASVIDDLENKGYRVSITVGNVQVFDKSYTTGMPDDYYRSCITTMVRIKNYHQSLSIGQIIGCCHPSFLRYLFFGHWRKVFRNVGGAPGGLGHTASMDDIKKVLMENAESDTVYIPNSRVARGNISSVRSAIEMVNELIPL